MILGICGSPRNNTTHYVLTEALNKLQKLGFETELFTVKGKNINPCQHCNYCMKNKKCIIDDNIQDLYPLLLDADGIIIASPVHCGGISSQIKMIMERTRALEAVDFNILKDKVGMSILVGGDRVGGQELGIQEINTFYIIHNIIPVGGGPFGANLGASLWSQDSLDKIKDDEYGFNSLDKTLKNFVYYLNKI